MPYTPAGKNNMLDGGGVTHISLHSDIPDVTGSNELTGGSPAYARKAITLGAASGGSKASTTTPTFDVPAGPIFFQGNWDSISGGTFLGWQPINGGSVFGVGTADDTSNAITSNGHGLVNDDRVFLESVASEALPTGLLATLVYFVVNATTDTFKLSLTSGGSAVDITALGEVSYQRVIPENPASQSTVQAASVVLTLNG